LLTSNGNAGLMTVGNLVERGSLGKTGN